MTPLSPAPWRVKVVEPIRRISREERAEIPRRAGHRRLRADRAGASRVETR